MTADIVTLNPKDRLHRDPQPIDRLYREMGTNAAENAVNRAVGELALALSGVSAQLASHDLGDAPRQLARIARMADHLGMVTLARCARDAESCLSDFDATAFAAIWRRLLRVAARQITVGGVVRDRQG